MAVQHMSKITTRKLRSGGKMTTTGTLCNRMSNAGEDMNVADDEAGVTCKFCLKELNRLKIRKALRGEE